MKDKNDYLNPTEEQEHKTLVEWLNVHKILFCHVPNEGDHRVQYRVKQKQLGVASGVPDILIFDPPPESDYVGVAIELKRKKGGRITPAQIEWLENLKERSWVAAVCRGAGEAIKLLESLGYGRRRRKLTQLQGGAVK